MNNKVDFFFEKAKKWQSEIALMRDFALDCQLIEELKWGCPCYTLNRKNIVLIHTFKEYCAFLFFKGALIQDDQNILIQQSENVQAARQLRFTKLADIVENEAVIKSYIFQAIEIEKAGLQVELKKTKEYEVPEEFQNMLDQNPEIKSAFKALTPGRQRGYLLYFSAAKQSKTRENRIKKYIPFILARKGIND